MRTLTRPVFAATLALASSQIALAAPPRAPELAYQLTEGQNLNAFVRDGAVTAVEHPDALPGITRDTLIRLTGADSRPVPLEELLDADEVFACGTAAEVAPIAEIDGRSFDAASPLSREIAAVYAATVRGESSWSGRWLTRV